MVIIHGRMLDKTGMVAVGPYRFIRYINNSGLVAEVAEKTGTMQKVSSSHLLPCFSMPKKVQIDEHPVNIINKDAGEYSMVK